jgi:hypothetical protein
MPLITDYAPGRHLISEMVTVPSNTHMDLSGYEFVTAPGARLYAKILIKDAVNVRLTGGIFNGNLPHQPGPWYEHQHEIICMDSRDVWLLGPRFIDPMGDCVLLERDPAVNGPGVTGFKILDWSAQGTGANRNALSVVCASDVECARFNLRGMSRSDMPGAIDLEPNTPVERAHNVWIHHGTISGGNHHGIQLYNGVAHTTQFGQVLIEDVLIEGPRDCGIWAVGSAQVTEGPVTIRRVNIREARTPVYTQDMIVTHVKRTRRKKRRR